MKRLVFIVAVLGGGCASSPPPPRERPSPKSSTAAIGTSAATSDREPVRGLTLERALELADASHPSVARGQAEIEAASGRAQQAGTLPNPTAVFRSESSRLRGKTFALGEDIAGLYQPVPISGRLGAAERVEERGREELEREVAVRRLEVHAKVRAAFATALYFSRVLAVHEATSDQAKRVDELTQARAKAGDARPEDVARAGIEVARVELEVIRARGRSREALVELEGAIAAPGLAIASVTGSLDAAFDIPAIEELARHLDEHPAMMSALARVAVEDARIDLAERLRIPDMYVELYYRRLQHSNVDSFDAGFGFLVPVFDRSEGRIREARANRGVALAGVKATERELEAQLRGAHARLVTALAVSAALRDKVLPKADVVLAAAERRFKAGDASLTDVVFARRERTAHELAYVEALRDALEAWGALLPFVGRAGE